MASKFSKDYAKLFDIGKMSFQGIDEQDLLNYVGAPIIGAEFVPYNDEVQDYLRSIDVYLYLLDSFKESWCRSVSEAMLTGLPVIVQNRSPFIEYIFNGHNGFLIDDVDEIPGILKLPYEQLQKVGKNGRDTMRAIMDPDNYLKSLKQIVDGEYKDLRLKPVELETWIFSDKQLKTRHTLVENTDLLYALNFISRLNFKDAYLFLDKLPLIPSSDIMKLYSSIFQLGLRGLKFHLCTDSVIPDDLKPLFAHISILSKEEGLKQVRAR